MIPSPSQFTTPESKLQYKLDEALSSNVRLAEEVFSRMQAADKALEQCVAADRLMSRCYLAFTTDTTEEVVKALVADLEKELGIESTPVT